MTAGGSRRLDVAVLAIINRATRASLDLRTACSQIEGIPVEESHGEADGAVESLPRWEDVPTAGRFRVGRITRAGAI